LREGDVVDAQVQQGASGELVVKLPVGRVRLGPEAERRRDELDGADRSVVQPLPHSPVHGQKARPERFHQEQVLRLRQRDQIRSLEGIDRERLLHQDRLAGFQAQASLAVMEPVRAGDVDRVDLRIASQRLIRIVVDGRPVPLRKGLAALRGSARNRMQSGALDAIQGLRKAVGDPPRC